MSSSSQSKQQKLALNKKYKTFLQSGNKPENNYSNPANLFDDSNLKDKAFMESTKMFLSARRQV